MQCLNIIYVFTVLTLCASISTALNCYQCNSYNNPECYDLRAHLPHNVSIFHQPCGIDEEGREPFCRTITYKFKFLKDDNVLKKRVIRTCGFRRSQLECYHSDTDHATETVCQCFEDGCNSAANLSIFGFITTSLIAFALYLNA